MNINPTKYDFLWSSYCMSYFTISLLLHKYYKKYKFLLIYNSKNKESRIFLSKSSRQKLFLLGVKLYNDNFDKWENNMQTAMLDIENILNEKINIASLSKFQLTQGFLSRIKIFRHFTELYFLSEFFLLNKVELQAKTNPKIQRNLEKMSIVKFKARKLINLFWKNDGYFKKWLDIISNKTKILNLSEYSYDDIILLIKNNKPISRIDLVSNDWFICEESNWLPSLENSNELNSTFEQHFFQQKPAEISGMIANKGFFRGKVKIIETRFDHNHTNKIDKETVLVASTTGPELTLACKKAGAIITDQGGTTCHAAIISREFKIPCIVGTKIATKVLNNGDIVEVDAYNGTVKKI